MLSKLQIKSKLGFHRDKGRSTEMYAALNAGLGFIRENASKAIVTMTGTEWIVFEPRTVWVEIFVKPHISFGKILPHISLPPLVRCNQLSQPAPTIESGRVWSTLSCRLPLTFSLSIFNGKLTAGVDIFLQIIEILTMHQKQMAGKVSHRQSKHLSPYRGQ